MKSRGAGLVVQMELIDFLKEHGIVAEEAISIPAYKRQYLSQDGRIQWEEQTLQRMTSWDTLYRQLRNALPEIFYHTEAASMLLRIDDVIAGSKVVEVWEVWVEATAVEWIWSRVGISSQQQ